MKSQSSHFIWYDHHGKGNNRYALFRRSFDLAAAPAKAEFHLFADERNHGVIEDNTVRVEFGADDDVQLTLTFDKALPTVRTFPVTTELLGRTQVSGWLYVNPNGSPLKMDTDYFGKGRSESNPSAGPFENPGDRMISIKTR